MPAAVIAPAIITAVGAAGGAALSARAANRATSAQERAAQDALAYAREQEATRQAQYKEQYAAWEQQRDALYKHYGIDTSRGPAPGGGAPAAMPAAARGPLTLGDLVRQPGAPMTGLTKPGQGTPEEMPEDAEWNDWRNYIGTQR